MLETNLFKTLAGLLILSLGLILNTHAQTGNWDLVSYSSGDYDETGGRITGDSQGNLYHAGSFSNNFSLNGLSLQGRTGPSSSGTYLSRLSIGSSSNSDWTILLDFPIINLITDPFDNIIFTIRGYPTVDTVHIGPNYTLALPSALASNETVEILVKMDTQGNVLWTKRIGGRTDSREIYLTDLATNGAGDIYLAGHIWNEIFSGGASSGDLILDSIAVSINGTEGNFVAKANTNGDFIWAKVFGSNIYQSNDREVAIAVNQFDEIFVSSGCSIDSLFVDSFSAISEGGLIYIAKFNSLGQAQWLTTEVGWAYNNTRSIAINALGHPIQLTSFTDNSDTLKLNNGNIAVSGSGPLLTQYNRQGNFEFYRKYPIHGDNDYSLSFISGAGSDIFIATTSSKISITLANIVLNTAGESDVIISKIDSQGYISWADRIGSDEIESIGGIYYSPISGLNINGSTFSSQLNIGNQTINNSIFYGSDSFVANLNTNGLGLKESLKQNSLHFYPNPTQGLVHFSIGDSEAKNLKITIQNILGQKLFEKSLEIGGGAGSINLSFLKPGAYLILLQDGKKEYLRRFIKN
jgi:hypothetical protein